MNMIEQEFAIGDYIQHNKGQLGVTNFAREQMVTLIESLWQKKQYRLETLYLAVSLSDRYLVNLAINNRAAPNLVTLAVVVVLIAAKIE